MQFRQKPSIVDHRLALVQNSDSNRFFKDPGLQSQERIH